MRKVRTIFDKENWLWKSEIEIFRSLDLEQMLIWQKKILLKSAIFYSIKLPFDEKFLNVIYFLCTEFVKNGETIQGGH